jgi:hypothetical protein
MQLTPLLVLGLAILAYAFTRAPGGIKPTGSQPLEGWQKLLSLVAVIMAVLIIINPEFLALGLVGDATFFDVLVLLLSLQLQMVGTRAWRWLRSVTSTTMRVMILRNSMSFSYMVLALAVVGNAVSAIQKAVHRLSS